MCDPAKISKTSKILGLGANILPISSAIKVGRKSNECLERQLFIDPQY
jgi:hypothetical protein